MGAYGPPGAPAGGCCSGYSVCGTLCFSPYRCTILHPLHGATVILRDAGLTQIGTTCTVVSKVVSIAISSQGTGYTSAPTVTITPSSGGSGATATSTLGGPVASLTLTAGGSGYYAPLITLSGGGGSGATASAQINGSLQSVTLTAGGSGYTTAPTVTITAGFGGGSGASATATIAAGIVTGFTIVAAGSGYRIPPSISLGGGGGTGAHGAAVTAGPISSVTLVTPGTSYTSVPAISITDTGGGMGTGGAITVGWVANRVVSGTVTAGGSGYNTNPTVSFSGGGGSGAAGSAQAAGTCCFDVSTIGTYTATASHSGYPDGTASLTLSGACTGGTTNANIFITPTSVDTIYSVFSSCNGGPAGIPIAGATVAVTGLTSGTTNSLGQATITEVPGTTYAHVGSFSPRFTSSTSANFTPNACNDNTVSIVLSPASGYHCVNVCGFPIADTIHLGGATLSYIGTSLGVTTWSGSLTSQSSPAGCNCPAFTYDLAIVLQTQTSGSPWLLSFFPTGGTISSINPTLYPLCHVGDFSADFVSATCPESGAFMVSFNVPAGRSPIFCAGSSFTGTE